MKIRCSSLPLIAKCGQAAVAPRALIDVGDAEPRDLGTAAHQVLLGAIGSQSTPWSDQSRLERAAAMVEDRDELMRLIATGWRLWAGGNGHRGMREYFPTPVVEPDAPQVYKGMRLVLTGHFDVAALIDHTLRIADFKTGRVDADPQQQLRGYAWLGLQTCDADKVYACQIRVRDGICEGWRWTRDELSAWWSALEATAGIGAYRPGRHCAGCPRLWECDEARTYFRRSISMLTYLQGAEPETLAHYTPAQVHEAYAAVKIAETVAKDARETLRALVMATGQPEADGTPIVWDGDDGVAVKKRTTTGVLFGPGETILREALGERLGEAVAVRKGEAVKIVRDGAGRGAKQAAEESFLSRLEDAGAITVTTQDRLELVRRSGKGMS